MKVVLIGAGNLATHLGLALKQADIEVLQVYSRTVISAKYLAEKLACSWTIDFNEIIEGADFYIFSVKDSALEQVIAEVCSRIKEGVFVHTAGSMSVNIFNGKANRFGVFYPLQTFSKERYVDFKEISIFIEGSSENVSLQLDTLAQQLSLRIYPIKSEVRQFLHLAAVWSCNFTNHCYAIAHEVLEQQQIPFEVLLPLINETTRKVNSLSPKDAQTGPAVRYDKNVIVKQMQLMKNNPLWQALYEQLSQSIYNMNINKRKEKL